MVDEVCHHERSEDGYLPRHPYPHIYGRDAITNSSTLGRIEIHLRQSRVRVQDDALHHDGSIREPLGQLGQLRLESLRVWVRGRGVKGE